MIRRWDRGLARFATRLTVAALLAAALLAGPLGHVRSSSADTMAVPIPADIGRHEHWIDVNLSQEIAVAMDGGTAVQLIFVTTGGPGWETPTGTFHILNRVEDETMKSDSLGIPIDSPGGYDLDHVMYTQYFTTEGHALHDNYWQPHSVFGSKATSHGCVGMELNDAKFLWDFLAYGGRVVIHS
jgi:lipoprotein-anchoring transpeptidase ErfK/SrfK